MKREPNLGIKRIDTHLTPVIGPRLVGTSREPPGAGQAALTIISLNGTYQAKATRLAVNRLDELLKTLPPRPVGLNLALTGSAMVGHDMNEASNKSIANTTYTTIALVVVILLVVYRSPVLALIPLLTIALSAATSLKSIALLTLIPGLKFQVINITNVFVIVVLFGAGTDYCLFLIARYREELIRGRSRPDALREAIVQVGGALVASAGTVIIGLGMLWFSSFAKIQYTGPAIALSLAIALLAALTLAPVLLYWLRGAVFWPFRAAASDQGARPRTGEPGADAAGGFLGQGGQPRGPLPGRDPVALRARPGAPGRGRGADPAQLQPARRPLRRPAQRSGVADRPPLFRRGRAQPDADPGREPTAELPLGRRAAGAIAALSRRLQAIARSRRGPLGLAAARQAGRAARPDELHATAHGPDDARRRRFPVRQHHARQAAGPRPYHPDRRRVQGRPLLRRRARRAREGLRHLEGGHRTGPAAGRGDRFRDGRVPRRWSRT